MRRLFSLALVLAVAVAVAVAVPARAQDGTVEVSAFFLIDGIGSESTDPPHLAPAARLASRESPAAGAMSALLLGPSPAESPAVPPMSTAIPVGTHLHGVSIAGGVATVDLSREFVSGGGSLSMIARLAQVVFTLTQFPTVDGVVLEIDGVPTTVFGGEGIVLPSPADRGDFLSLVPLVLLADPPTGGFLGNPARIRGVADVFEGTVQLAIVDNEGLILWEGFATTAAPEMGSFGSFAVDVAYDVAQAQWGAVIAWWDSPMDGSHLDVREHPAWLAPRYEGDQDLGLFDPDTAVWRFWIGPDTPPREFLFGNPGDVPLLGDWDCDDVDTAGLFRTADGYVYLRNTNTTGIADLAYYFGNPGDIPIAGDFDGDGCDTVSLYRPSEQRFYIVNHLGSGDAGIGAADSWFDFGNPADTPMAGDFDGDGVDEVGLHRRSTGLVYYEDELAVDGAGGVADHEFVFGDPGDLFVTGDWNDDGTDTPGLYRQTALSFMLRFTNGPGRADAIVTWGAHDWLPVAGEAGW